ncbi:hypothetical protein [Secundilactobacillus oryzae]|uniref:hypothetical protein n=1 Tax=Secundilactobacillus oryzae TaxID=1202668 RepID=UPI0006D280AF|nr:hypothetical protein [Secundilactobacillus oryzae]
MIQKEYAICIINKKDDIMQNSIYSQYLSNDRLSDLFGLALLRDVVLPDLMGDDVNNILYFEGKKSLLVDSR